jgi:hypothetical protein
MNGLIVSDREIETIRCRHSGNVIDDVIEGTYSVLNRSDMVIEHAEEMKSLILPEAAQNIFAKAAASLRWDEEELPINPVDLNRAKRYEDKAPDLFTTFNRVQENIIRGGVRGKNKNGGRLHTRAVNSVGENIRLNKALWTLSEEMKALMA